MTVVSGCEFVASQLVVPEAYERKRFGDLLPQRKGISMKDYIEKLKKQAK